MELLEPQLTDLEREQYEQKAAELAKECGVPKVYVSVQINRDNGNERIVSYIKEPNYMTKLHLMDKATALGSHQAGDEFREMCQIKEHSHPLTHSDHPEADKYKLGVVQRCLEIITMVLDEFKKK